MTEVVKITESARLEAVIALNDKAVVAFGAPAWCIPCRRLTPHFEAASQQLTEVPFVEVDIDLADQGIKDKFTIMSVPTVLLFKNGAATEIRGRTALQIVSEVKNA